MITTYTYEITTSDQVFTGLVTCSSLASRSDVKHSAYVDNNIKTGTPSTSKFIKV